MSRRERVLAAVDAINAADPRTVTVDGEGTTVELIYSRRMRRWLDRLQPDSGDELVVAVHAQHVARWRIPRALFPEGRAGYKRWRSRLGQLHGHVTASVMLEHGYDQRAAARVDELLRKKGLGRDPEVQVVEDAACLVFLEHYLGEFVAGRDPEKSADIIRKTWTRMSARARELALKIDLPEDLKSLIAGALSGG